MQTDQIKQLYWRFNKFVDLASYVHYGILAGIIVLVLVIPLESWENSSVAGYFLLLVVALFISWIVEIILALAHKQVSNVIGKCQVCGHRLRRHENAKGVTHPCRYRNWNFKKCNCDHFVRKEA